VFSKKNGRRTCIPSERVGKFSAATRIFTRWCRPSCNTAPQGPSAGPISPSTSDAFLGTLVPHQAEPADCSRLAEQATAYLLAHQKRTNDALDSCRAFLNVGRAAGGQPSLSPGGRPQPLFPHSSSNSNRAILPPSSSLAQGHS